MKSTGGPIECLCLPLYADLLRFTSLFDCSSVSSPPHKYVYKLFLLQILAHSTVLLQSSILFVPDVLFTIVSKHHLLGDEDRWQGEVIVFFRGKDICQL